MLLAGLQGPGPGGEGQDLQGSRQVEVIGHGVPEPPVQLGRLAGELGWGLGGGPLGHPLAQPAEPLLLALQRLPREVHLAAVPGPEAEQPERQRVVPLVSQLGHAGDVPFRLRHLLAGLLQEPPVHPDRDDPVAGGAVRLGHLVLVVGEPQVVAAGVDVEALAQVLHGHGRALDVPSGEPLAPRARPPHQASVACPLPQREVLGVALLRVDLQLLAVPGAEGRQRVPRQLPVVGERVDVEVHVAPDLVGQAPVNEALRELDHLRDVVRGPRVVVGALDVQRVEVLQERRGVLRGDLLGREALVGDGDVHAVAGGLADVVRHVTDVRDVHDLDDVLSLEPQPPPDEVPEHERSHVPDVGVAIHGRAAGVDLRGPPVGGLDLLDLPAERVVQAHPAEQDTGGPGSGSLSSVTLMDRDLGLAADQLELVELARRWADERAAPVAARFEEEHRFPRELFAELGGMGFGGIPYDERFGGGGQSYLLYLCVLEEVARAFLSLGVGLSVHHLCAFGIHQFGSDALKERYLPALFAGEPLGAYGLSEASSGSDAASLRTRAERANGGGYRITGSKRFISHAGEAETYLVMARTGGGGPDGISAFVVEKGWPGFEFGRVEAKMGGEEGIGFRVALAALDGGRLGIAACSTGLAQAALEAAVAFARERSQFGRPVVENQGVQFMLADMAVAVEASRRLYREAARARDGGDPFSTAASMAKLFASDAAMRVTTDAVQLHGGYGYMREYPVARYMREAKALQIVEGTNQIQRMVIGRHLAGGCGRRSGSDR